MKERPILFSAPMVRALLSDTKTQTRRALNPQPVWVPNWGIAVGMNGAWRVGSPAAMGLSCRGDYWSATFDEETIRRYATAEAYGWGARAGCPYGQPGDRLWVKETWTESDSGNGIVYRADMTLLPKQRDREIRALFAQRCRTPAAAFKWKSSMFMRREYSRILLEVTGVRVERLQDISEGDVIKEGCPNEILYGRGWYRDLWESLNGAGSWEANPWVWVIEFKRLGTA